MPPNYRPVHEEQEQKALAFISSRVAAGGAPPTMQEVADHLGLPGSVSGLRVVRRLEKAGHLDITGRHRGIKLANPPGGIVLADRGRVSCGPPLEPEDGDERLDLGAWFRGDDLASYTAVGQSMIDDGIFPGDRLIVRECPDPANGQKVIAMVDREMLCKKYYLKGDGFVYLKACNAEVGTLVVDPSRGHFRVLGELRYVVRKC